MIQMLTAYTVELDDTEDAVNEIFSQLDLNALKKYSVGLINCYYEFTDNGIVDAIRAKLPFEVIGMTTMASAGNGACGMYQLTLTILTSDDVSFSSAISESLSKEECEKFTNNAYREAREKLAGDPSLIIALLPIMNDLSGAEILAKLDGACGGIPIFGSLCSDVTINMENGKVFRDGQFKKDAVALILLHGPVKTRFVTKSLPERNVAKRQALVTESDGFLVKKVDGMMIDEYLRSLGISVKLGRTTASTPLLVTYPNASDTVSLGIYQWNDDGSALCGGSIPVGSTIALGNIDREGIFETAETALEEVLADGGEGAGILLFPCVSRHLMLAPDSDEEMRRVIAIVEKTALRYALSYSGGEICPVRGKDGVLYNRLHNYTFTACVLS